MAPLGTLNAYMVYEYELELLAGGSPASLYLNFALFLLAIAATLVATLLTTTIPTDRAYYGFLIVAALSSICGLVLLGLWWHGHSIASGLLDRIKARMPTPPTAVSEGGGSRRLSKGVHPMPAKLKAFLIGSHHRRPDRSRNRAIRS